MTDKTIINEYEISQKTVVNSENTNLHTVINNDFQRSYIPQIGDSFANNGYRIIDIIAVNSGEADIYIIHSTNSNKDMVLKLYRRKNAIKSEVIKQLSTIDNTNVSKIIDFGEIGGFPYIIMPFYKNGSLADFIQKGEIFAESDLKDLIIPSIIDGLKAIHDAGILHKDIKPSNLMFSDDKSHIVLIDFGISSVTNGNTVVVTNTGKTPFYSAPETNHGIFLEESDYYSLGITLYELVTGKLPFQDISAEMLDAFLHIQRIVFPKDFYEDLKCLIIGLTFNDISDRKNLANPNRRWGYLEVKAWLRGEHLSVPGISYDCEKEIVSTQNIISEPNINSVTNIAMPYSFNNEIYYNNLDLIKAFLQEWDLGKEEFYRGKLTEHYKLAKVSVLEEICVQAEHLYLLDIKNEDIAFMHAMYRIEPSITYLYWKGLRFESITNYGLSLLEALKNSEPNKYLILSASELLTGSILKNYINLTNPKDKDDFLKIIESQSGLLEQKPLSPLLQAQRLGNAIAFRTFIKIGSESFDSIEDFNKYLLFLYDNNLAQLHTLIKDSESEIEEQLQLFTTEKQAILSNTLDLVRDVIKLGASDYYYKNINDFLEQVGALWLANNISLFQTIVEIGRDYLNEVKTKYELDINNQIEECLQRSSSIIYFEGVYFNNCRELVNYINSVPSALRKRFITNKEYKFKKIVLKLPLEIQAELLRCFDFKILLDLNLNYYLGFGKYWINSSYKKEPIEWIVLTVKDDRVLLLSKYALACKKYNDTYTSVTWENSSLRHWLNTIFINDAFNNEEQEKIIDAVLNNSNNLMFNTLGGNDTVDKVFLLSIEDVEEYLKNFSKCSCHPSKYSINNNVWIGENDCCYQWLRGSGDCQESVACIRDGGGVTNYGVDVDTETNGVRVALWLKIDI